MQPVNRRAAAVGALLIGIGNELRGDDAAGPEVVRRVEAAGRRGGGGSGWRTLSLHGLTPELADDLALAEVVVFVDATTAPLSAPRCSALQPSAASERLLGHALSPAALLGLCQALHGRHPTAELIEIPACSFELGAPLSPLAAAAAEAVSEDLLAWRIPRRAPARSG